MTGGRRAWWLVGLLTATGAASYLCRVNISVAGALMMREFGFSQVVMGRVFSAFLLGYAVFQVPAGMLADRYGARRVLAGAALWWVGSTILLAAVGWGPLAVGGGFTLAAVLAIRLVLGVGESPTFPAAGQAVARWIPPVRQGRANGMVIASIGFGSAVAPPVLSEVMVHWGWRAALLVSALPALAVGLGWLAVREPEEKQAQPAPAAAKLPGAGRQLRSRSFVLLTISYTLEGYVGYIFVFWFYLYLVEVRHFDLLRSAVLGSLPWVLSIVSIPLGGMISDRLVESRLGLMWGRRLVPLAGFAGSALFLSLGAHTGNAWFAAVALALSTALVLATEGPFWATMMEIAPARSGAAGGFMNMGSNIGGLISPALTPVLAASMGWENALHVASGVALVAGVLWFGIAPAGLREPAGNRLEWQRR